MGKTKIAKEKKEEPKSLLKSVALDKPKKTEGLKSEKTSERTSEKQAEDDHERSAAITSGKIPNWLKILKSNNYVLVDIKMKFENSISIIPQMNKLSSLSEFGEAVSRRLNEVTIVQRENVECNDSMQKDIDSGLVSEAQKSDGQQYQTANQELIADIFMKHNRILGDIQNKNKKISTASIGEIQQIWQEKKEEIEEVLRDPSKKDNIQSALQLLRDIHKVMESNQENVLPEDRARIDEIKQNMDSKLQVIRKYETDINLLERKEGKKRYIKERFKKLNENPTPVMMLAKTAKKVSAIGNQGEDIGTDTDGGGLGKAAEVMEEVGAVLDVHDASGEIANGKRIRDNPNKKPEDATKESSSEMEAVGELRSIYENLKDLVDFIKGCYAAYKDWDKMSEENKKDVKVNLITSGLSLAGSLSEQIGGWIKEVPLLGQIIGLIGNAINFFKKGYDLISAWDRICIMREQKKALKRKMIARKEKYQKDDDLKSLNLYSFASASEDKEKIHIDKKDAESSANPNGYRAMQRFTATKKKSAQDIMMEKVSSKKGEGKKEYYQAKAAAAVAEHDELKEAIHRNKNLRRDSIIDLSLEAASLAGNIAGFFPGIGDIISGSLSITTTMVKEGKKWGGKALQRIKNHFGIGRTDESKKENRRRMAEDLLANLNIISSKMASDDKFDIASIKDEEIKIVERSYDTADHVLGGVGAYMPKMIGAKNKEELIERMRDAFSVEG